MMAKAVVAHGEGWGAAHAPVGGFGAVSDDGGVAGGAEIGFAGGGEEGGDEFAEGVADADALEVGEADEAMFAVAGADGVGEGEDGDEGGGGWGVEDPGIAIPGHYVCAGKVCGERS